LSISSPFLSGAASRELRRTPIFQLQKHKKKTVRELRLPEPLHLIRTNIASFVRFSRPKLACWGKSNDDPAAKQPHCIVIAFA
jgi:hypothetical protein